MIKTASGAPEEIARYDTGTYQNVYPYFLCDDGREVSMWITQRGYNNPVEAHVAIFISIGEGYNVGKPINLTPNEQERLSMFIWRQLEEIMQVSELCDDSLADCLEAST